MAIQLESGLVLLTETESEEYRAAARWLVADRNQVIDLSQPMSLGEHVDLIIARCVVEDDADGFELLTTLFDAEMLRRKSPQ